MIEAMEKERGSGMSYANIFTESNVDLLNDPAVKQLLDYIAELEAERDQLRQQLEAAQADHGLDKTMTFDHWWDSTASTGSPDTYSGWQESCRQAWEAGQQDEREECAKTCEALWQEEATAAANGTQEPKYHDCIECAHAIRERSNAKVSELSAAGAESAGLTSYT